MNYYRRLRPIRSGEHTVSAVLEKGNRVVSLGRFKGEKTDGMKIDIMFADELIIEHSRVKDRRVYFCQPAL